MALPDIRVTVYRPDMSEILALDASQDIGRAQLKYADSPDGSNAAATIPLVLRFEDIFARGYWTEWNIVEISSGDNVLVQNAPLLSGGGAQKYYLDTNWGFDTRLWMDDQVAYFWDGLNLTQRCPVWGIGFDNAPTIVNRTSGRGTGVSLSIPLISPPPTPGNQLILIVCADLGISLGVNPAGWSFLGSAANGMQLAVYSKTATSSDSAAVITASGSATIMATIVEISNAGALNVAFDASQNGPLLWSPPLASPGAGALALNAFSCAVGGAATTPRGWAAESATSTASTTLTEVVTPAPGLQTVSVASSVGLAAGVPAFVGVGASQESVTLTAVAGGAAAQLQGVFHNSHSSGEPVTGLTASTTLANAVAASPYEQTASVVSAAGLYVGQSVQIGTGADVESVVLAAVSPTWPNISIQAVFTKSHANGETVQAFTETTLTAAVVGSPLAQNVGVAASSGFAVGQSISVGTASDLEPVVLTAVTSGGPASIQGLFSKFHPSGDPVVATATGANALATFSAPCTDSSTLGAATGFQGTTGTPGGVTMTLTVAVPSGLTPQPWILCTTSLNGGGTPAYEAYLTTVGRRRYAGVVQRRQRPNQKTPSATVTLTGMAEYLNRAEGNFAFTQGQNIDIGAAIFSVLNLFATQWPFFTIDQRNFPTLGQTYDGTWTASQVSSALSSMLVAIASGDGWYMRIGHDFTPRLLPLYRDATDTYISNVTVQQSTPPQALAFTLTDCDVTQFYNRILVTGDTDPLSGVPVSAVVVDEASYAFYGLYFDGQPVQVQGLKTTLECARYAQSLLDQHSLAASAGVLTVYTRYNPGARVTLPGGMLQGDVLPPVAHITATGFAATAGGITPPDVTGLASVIVTTIDCGPTDATDSFQTANFSAMMPDWLAAIAEQANATGNAFGTNTGPNAGIDQYFVDASAYPPSISGFKVTVPSFYAVFAQGTLPVLVGGNSFTVAPNSTCRAWLSPSNQWTIVTDDSLIVGSIPYLFVQSNVSGIVGTIQTAQVGLLEIPAAYLLEGGLPVPIVVGPSGSGPATLTVSASGALVSQITIKMLCENQPTDGSLVKAILYYRQLGQPTWLQFATSPPRNATPGADGQGAALTNGAVANVGLYVWIYPEAANGPDFEFGFALESNRGTETAIVSIANSQVVLGVPAGAVLTIAPFGSGSTGSIVNTSGTTQFVTFQLAFTISGTTQTNWVFNWIFECGFQDPAFPAALPGIATISGGASGLSGTLVIPAVQLAQVEPSTPRWAYQVKLLAVARDGTVLYSNQLGFTIA